MTHAAQATVARCFFKDHGALIWIDENGPGQSTVSYFEQLPLDELKTDRVFVQFTGLVSGENLLVQCTFDLAHNLGLRAAVA